MAGRVTLALIRAALGRLPVWIWAIALVLAWGAWQRHQVAAAVKKERAAETELVTLQRDAAQHSIDTLARTVAVTRKAVNEAQTSAAADRAAAAAAADARRQLLDRAAVAGGGCAAAAAAPGSPTAGAAGLVPAELLDRVSLAAQQLAEIADDRRRAGLACERIGAADALDGQSGQARSDSGALSH